jgi:hypothetical protein
MFAREDVPARGIELIEFTLAPHNIIAAKHENRAATEGGHYSQSLRSELVKQSDRRLQIPES